MKLASTAVITLMASVATGFSLNPSTTSTARAQVSSTSLRVSYLDSISHSTPIATDNYKSSQRWRKKTKQLATLGPASSSFEMIEKLFLAGADVFRLNFSHGEHAQKKELLDIIREVEAKYDHPIAILGDLQGPKLRELHLCTIGAYNRQFIVSNASHRIITLNRYWSIRQPSWRVPRRRTNL